MREHVGSVGIFSGLGADRLDALAALCRPVDLAASQVLMRQGEAGDCLYLLTDGTLEVSVDDAGIDRLEPVSVVGEMALLASPVRGATVTAGPGGARVWRLERGDFERLSALHPDVLTAVQVQARPRLERTYLAPLLRERFGAEDEAEIAALHSAARWVRVTRGERLIEPGAAAPEVFLVVSGLLEVRTPDGERPRSVGRGGVVGEDALADDVHRSSVTARRDTDVAAFPADMAAASPRFVSRLARDLIARTSRPEQAVPAGARLALVPASEGAPVVALSRALAGALEGLGSALVLTSTEVDRRFGREGVAQTQNADELGRALTLWLEDQARAFDHLVLVADPVRTEWSRRCERIADTVVLVAAADGREVRPSVQVEAPAVGARRPAGGSAVGAAAAGPRVELVLVHDDDATKPTGTRQWLDLLEPRAHHHVRLGRASDIARLGRRLAGRAVGLALSGGGARGYVHLGLLAAMEERGVPVDIVFGTSMGAVIGGAYAATQDAAGCTALASRFGDKKRLMDMTLPLVALTRSKRVNETLKEMFAEATLIEDLWVPFACVSASLTNAEIRLHDRGPLWRAVRASAAIPGVFTPVMSRDGGEVLVDGGVMNNLPADLLRESLGPGTVIASNAYGGKAEGRTMAFGDDVSGWSVLRSKVLPFGRKVRAPTLLGTLMRSTSLASKRLLDEAGKHADLVITYPSSEVTSLEFDHHEETIAIGHRHASQALDEWLASRDAVGAST